MRALGATATTTQVDSADGDFDRANRGYHITTADLRERIARFADELVLYARLLASARSAKAVKVWARSSRWSSL